MHNGGMHYETSMRVGVWGCVMGQVTDYIRNLPWANPEMFYKSMHLKMGLSSVADSLIHRERLKKICREVSQTD